MTRLFLLLSLLLSSPVWAAQTITFAHYNLENYLPMERKDHGQVVFAPKPESEITPLLRIIHEINPDILGVAEMGPPDQFDAFQGRLKAIGLDYPFAEYVNGPDPDRHLALLSRFRIIARDSQPKVIFDLNGTAEAVRRGFLDVTIEVNPLCRLRLIGAHLKSKLPVPEGESLVRRNEAQKLREHLDDVLVHHPDVYLVVFGDLNDTKDQPAIAEITGPRESPLHLADLWLADRLGDHWTYYRRFTDTYARIDYILVNDRLWHSVERQKSYIYRSPDWNQASDHRPIVAVIRAGE